MDYRVERALARLERTNRMLGWSVRIQVGIALLNAIIVAILVMHR